MPQVDIKLVSTADTSGAEKMNGALEGVGAASVNAGKKSEAAARGLNTLGEGYERGSSAGRAFKEVINGNVASVGQLGVELKLLGTLMKANLVGVLVSIGALAAQFIVPLVTGFKQAREELEKMSASAKASKEAFEALNDSKLDRLNQQLKSAEEGAADALKKFQEIADAQDKIASSKYASDMAKLDADGSLTPEQRKARKDQLQAAEAERQRQRPVAASLEEYQQAQIEAGKKRQYAEETAGKYGDMTDAIGLESFRKLPDLLKKRDALRSELEGYEKTRGFGGAVNKESERERVARAELQAIEAQTKREDQASYTTKGKYDKAKYDEELKRREKMQADIDAQFDTVNRSVELADQNAKRQGERYFLANRVAQETGKYDREKTQAENQPRPPTDEQLAARKKQEAEFQEQARKAMEAGDWTAQDKAIADKKKADADWAKKYGTGDTAAKRATAAPNPGYELGPDGVMRRKGADATSAAPKTEKAAEELPKNVEKAAAEADKKDEEGKKKVEEAGKKTQGTLEKSAKTVAESADKAVAAMTSSVEKGASAVEQSVQKLQKVAEKIPPPPSLQPLVDGVVAIDEKHNRNYAQLAREIRTLASQLQARGSSSS